MTPADPQRDPVGGGADILTMVIHDLVKRARAGELKYGMPLTSNNGRVALVDAYQEALDMAMYLRQEIEERWAAAEAVDALVAAARKVVGKGMCLPGWCGTDVGRDCTCGMAELRKAVMEVEP